MPQFIQCCGHRLGMHGALRSRPLEDFGQIIATGSPDEVRANEAVLAAYLGRPA